MQQLFEALTRAVEGTPTIALGAAFLWGVLSVVLSPCHLASIPLVVAFVSGHGKLSPQRALGLSCTFAAGILITIGLVGALTAAAGRMMGDIGHYGNYVVAAIFFVVGLHLLEIIPAPWSGLSQAEVKSRGYLAALTLGLLFGVALGPCTFAYMAPMLAVTFRLASANFVLGASLLLVFGLGHCSVIALAGASTSLVERYLRWNEASRGVSILRKTCGALVLSGGLYLIYTAP